MHDIFNLKQYIQIINTHYKLSNNLMNIAVISSLICVKCLCTFNKTMILGVITCSLYVLIESIARLITISNGYIHKFNML